MFNKVYHTTVDNAYFSQEEPRRNNSDDGAHGRTRSRDARPTDAGLDAEHVEVADLKKFAKKVAAATAGGIGYAK